MNKKLMQGMETKKRLIECARKLFSEKGFYNITVDDIVKEANSSKGSFYTHFKTKEDLIVHMLPIVDEEYRAFLKMDIKPENSIDKIDMFVRYAFKLIEKEIGLEFISAIYSAQIKNFKTEGFLISSERAYNQLLEKLIKEGQALKEIKQELDPQHIATIITSCIRGVIFDWCLYKGKFDLSNYGGEVISMILNQIKV